MKAVVFAAGVGSRLKPWTDSHPKALVEVGGTPMLGRVIGRLVEAGITDIIVNVHHFAEQIIEYVNSHDFGAKITISDESRLLLETGGGLRKVLNLLGDEPVLVHNADILSDFDIAAMVDAHRRSSANITLLTGQRATSRYLVFDSDGRMTGWTNIATGARRPDDLCLDADSKLRAFDGVHIISPAAYTLIKKYKPADTPFSITDFYIDSCKILVIKSYDLPHGNAWFDIGKPETLEKAIREFR